MPNMTGPLGGGSIAKVGTVRNRPAATLKLPALGGGMDKNMRKPGKMTISKPKSPAMSVGMGGYKAPKPVNNRVGGNKSL